MKETSGAGGYEPGSLLKDATTQLTQEQTAQFLEAVDRAQFWSLPARDPNQAGRDGAQWVMEGARGGSYHLVDRWTPRGGAFREVALILVNPAGLKVEPVY